MMLEREFFFRDPLLCARELIGCRLQWDDRAGIIVETEAYDTEGDEASHTFFRPSARVFVAAHDPGAAYVYFNYGVHWLFNVLVKGEREGFVLVRALEPIEGLAGMRKARGVEEAWKLCSGPGKLTQALGITGGDHGKDLCREPRQAFHAPEQKIAVMESPRIGISRAVHLPWRFYASGNRHVSQTPARFKLHGKSRSS